MTARAFTIARAAARRRERRSPAHVAPLVLMARWNPSSAGGVAIATRRMPPMACGGPCGLKRVRAGRAPLVMRRADLISTALGSVKDSTMTKDTPHRRIMSRLLTLGLLTLGL